MPLAAIEDKKEATKCPEVMEQAQRDKGRVPVEVGVLVRAYAPAQVRVGSVPAPRVVKRCRIKWGCHAISRNAPSVGLPWRERKRIC